MAGVYVPGVKKPYGCTFCPWCRTTYSLCKAANKNISVLEMNKGPDWCPLVEVPDHGDLIDESEKVDAQYYDDEFGEWSIKTKTVGEVLAEICEVPPKVVIPADKELV